MTEARDPAYPALYADYGAWKGWQDPFSFSPEESAYYRAELDELVLRDRNVVEIGFGNGAFLGWARAHGARIAGSEVTPAAVAAAEAAGIALIPPDFENGEALAAQSVDLVAAFDVFEHLAPESIVAKLAAIDRALCPGGTLLLRYPNGQSPFGLTAQHGDATHVTTLSRAKIEQYAAGTSLRTIHYGGVARPKAGSFKVRMARGLRFLLRDLHARLIQFLYATDVELEPVVVHVLRKPGGDARSTA